MARCEHCHKEHGTELRLCPATGKLFAVDRFFPADTLLQGKYRLKSLLGVGEAAAVYSAVHNMLDKRVVVKLLSLGHVKGKEFVRQLVKDIQTASNTGHRGIVGAIDLGFTDNGFMFMVSEFVDGQPLDQAIKSEAPVSMARAAWMLSEILSALRSAHRVGVVHGDLKPSNVRLLKDEVGQETIQIMDFCVARVKRAVPAGSAEGGPSNRTLTYLSPEQLRGQDTELDSRADIYACGVTLYHLLTGVLPYAARDPVSLIAAILEGAAPPPSERDEALQINSEMDQLVLRALSVDPEQRFANPGEFLQELEPFLNQPDDSTDSVAEAGALQAFDSSALEANLVSLVDLEGNTSPDDEEQGGELDLAAFFAEDQATPVEQPEVRAPAQTGKMQVTQKPLRERAPGPDRQAQDDGVTSLDAVDDPFAPPDAADPFMPPDPPRPKKPRHGKLTGSHFSPPADKHEAELALDQDVFQSGADSLPQTSYDDGGNWTVGDSGPVRPVRSTSRSLASKRDAEREADLHRPLLLLLLLLHLLALGWAIWPARGELWASVSGDYGGMHALDLMTHPADAEVWIDGVRQRGRPIRVARDRDKVSLRVRAAGYRSQRLQINPAKRGALIIKLKR